MPKKPLVILTTADRAVCALTGTDPAALRKYKAEMAAPGIGAASDGGNDNLFELPDALTKALVREAQASNMKPADVLQKIVRDFLDSDASETKRMKRSMGWGGA